MPKFTYNHSIFLGGENQKLPPGKIHSLVKPLEKSGQGGDFTESRFFVSHPVVLPDAGNWKPGLEGS
jgi:hypothetical protein